MKLVLIALLVFAVSAKLEAIPSIPTTELGFTEFSSKDAVLRVDAYWDPTCPDTLNSAEEMNKAFANMDWETYGLKLNILLFPLPYHRNSFQIS